MKPGLRRLIGLALVVFLSWPDTSHYFAQGVVTTAPWTGTWAIAPAITPDPGFNNQTIRHIVRTSIGGTAARLKFSNLFGAQPVTIGDVHVARRSRGARTIAGTDRPVTFNGQSYVTIPAGGAVQSDAVAFQVPALADIAVSFHIPSKTPPNSTGHVDGLQDVYVAPGDVSSDPAFAGGVVNAAGGQSYYFLTNVDVMNAAATGAVVAFGASITDGLSSTPNTNRRWPNLLANRLARAGMTVGVLNQGISGNDFFTDASGQAGLARFGRDVLGQANVKWVIVSDDAVNGLINGNPATYQQLVGAYRQLIRQAKAANVGVICSTLTPFKGLAEWTPAIESTREDVNAFLRDGGSGCDAVLDLAEVTGGQDGDSAAYVPAFNSGDDLHPNDAGMQAIAKAVDLTWFAALPPINSPGACGHIATGEGLALGESLAACSGNVALSLQGDGYLIAMQDGVAVWSSNVSGTPGVEIRMQEDGNLAMYDSNGAMVWQTHTSGNPGAYASIQKDGHLVIYSANGTALWSSAG
ncbi:GDSL-type esterase/lipase family protein [Caballeronia ptereochthonis]|uniref:Lipase/acylhydrolase n=1 Tax=Caballeronia ptereochthonis TaxID=1777144 RepID=A0A158AMH6_9BURK|nr:GDSL-type esterase/lipase family protein [Caballeronia ptereochthonis]SAK58890.1 lipase/acylhydrolase [Caballeronia ptereochthonis]